MGVEVNEGVGVTAPVLVSEGAVGVLDTPLILTVI